MRIVRIPSSTSFLDALCEKLGYKTFLSMNLHFLHSWTLILTRKWELRCPETHQRKHVKPSALDPFDLIFKPRSRFDMFRYLWQSSGTWCHPFLTRYQGQSQDSQVMLQNANLSHPNVVLNKPLQLDCARKLSGLQWFAILVFALSTRTFHVRRLWYRTLHPSCSTAAPAACKRDLFATAYRLRSGDHRATSLFQGGKIIVNRTVIWRVLFIHWNSSCFGVTSWWLCNYVPYHSSSAHFLHHHSEPMQMLRHDYRRWWRYQDTAQRPIADFPLGKVLNSSGHDTRWDRIFEHSASSSHIKMSQPGNILRIRSMLLFFSSTIENHIVTSIVENNVYSQGTESTVNVNKFSSVNCFPSIAAWNDSFDLTDLSVSPTDATALRLSERSRLHWHLLKIFQPERIHSDETGKKASARIRENPRWI